MKKFYPLFLIILAVIPLLYRADPVDKVISLIRQGNIHELSGLFADNLDLSVLGTEDTYAKVQAELILDKFFSQNKPGSVKMLHSINSNPVYRFGVILINTSNGPFRIAFTLKGSGDSMKLIDIRIETEKVR